MGYEIIIKCINSGPREQALLAEILCVQPGAKATIVSGPDVGNTENQNIALNTATEDVVILMDDDISQLPDNFAGMLVETLLSDPHNAFVSAVLLNDRGQLTMGGGIVGNQAIHNWLPMACVALHRSEIRFDESLPAADDVDFCWQHCVKDPLARFLIDPRVRVRHGNEEKWARDGNGQRGVQAIIKKWGRPP